MADLGFLPSVRRILEQTPRDGQRLLFSATLDKAIDVLVKQFLNQPVTHEADSAQSPISTMSHHVLHVDREHRLPVLVDLTSAPGRTVVFTRTKHGAKALARQLNKNGVPAVELHGNLSQNARTRNMEAFHSGKATTLVATDIAARGIHVDDVALVVHADPPVEHKAYLHRSGRTARAGAAGTVITLMTDEQVRDVRALTRAAGIKPTTTRITGDGPPDADPARPRRAVAARWPRVRGPAAAGRPQERRRSQPSSRWLRRRQPTGWPGRRPGWPVRSLRREAREPLRRRQAGQPFRWRQPRPLRWWRGRLAQRGLLQRPSLTQQPPRGVVPTRVRRLVRVRAEHPVELRGSPMR